MKPNIIVFLGPTLAVNEARLILPDAHYHAPVECGDILRVIRLKPDCLFIIDGLYERRAAVWHKEILCALEEKIPVIGASSMGALRAAELTHFGMIGVGCIYEDFYQGRLTDDDEVAVLHGPRASGYAPLNEALVSIRATVAKAIVEKRVSQAQGHEIINAAKLLHYPHRSLENACRTLKGDYSSLLQWAKHHAINQKKADAITALEYVKNHFPFKVTPREAVQKTIFIRNLAAYANTSAFDECYDFLPAEEKKLVTLEKEHHQRYQMLQELAQLFSVAHELSALTPSKAMAEIPLLRAEIKHYTQNDALANVYLWLQYQLQTVDHLENQMQLFKNWTRVLFNMHHQEAGFEAFITQYALLWFCFDLLTQNLELQINADDVQEKTTEFMEKNHIDSMESLQAFIADKISLEELNSMLIAHAYLLIVFKNRSFDFILPKIELKITNWLAVAAVALHF